MVLQSQFSSLVNRGALTKVADHSVVGLKTTLISEVMQRLQNPIVQGPPASTIDGHVSESALLLKSLAQPLPSLVHLLHRMSLRQVQATPKINHCSDDRRLLALFALVFSPLQCPHWIMRPEVNTFSKPIMTVGAWIKGGFTKHHLLGQTRLAPMVAKDDPRWCHASPLADFDAAFLRPPLPSFGSKPNPRQARNLRRRSCEDVMCLPASRIAANSARASCSD